MSGVDRMDVLARDLETVVDAAREHASRLSWLGYPESHAQADAIEEAAKRVTAANVGAVDALRAIRKGLYAYVHEEGIAELSAEEVYELADDAINALGGQSS